MSLQQVFHFLLNIAQPITCFLYFCKGRKQTYFDVSIQQLKDCYMCELCKQGGLYHTELWESLDCLIQDRLVQHWIEDVNIHVITLTIMWNRILIRWNRRRVKKEELVVCTDTECKGGRAYTLSCVWQCFTAAMLGCSLCRDPCSNMW